MKALVLAAGEGQRLRPLTNDRPKALVDLNGRTLFERQRRVFADLGITKVGVVTGYCPDRFDPAAVECFHNARWQKTNMVYSLFQAREFFEGNEDLLISYGDIVFESRVLRALLDHPAPIAITSDLNWYSYWSARIENVLDDVETLRLDDVGNVRELGQPARSAAEIEGQFMGLIRIKAERIKAITRFYDSWRSHEAVDRMYMTDFLQALIDRGYSIAAVGCRGGWLELDTLDDYEMIKTLAERDELRQFYADY